MAGDRPGFVSAGYTCAHCGQAIGDFNGGYAGVPLRNGFVALLCHPNDPARPDCYRRVTIWAEPLGALKGRQPLPAGVEGISKETDAFLQMVALTEELGLYEQDQQDARARITYPGGAGGAGATGARTAVSIGRGGGGPDPSIPECPHCGAYGGGGHGGGCPGPLAS